MEHPLDLVELGQMVERTSFVEQPDVPGNTNLSLELVSRTQSDSEKATEVSFGTPTCAFSDVGWHRYARPSDLVTQRVSSGSGEPSGGIDELYRQPIGALPHHELSEIMHTNRRTRG